MWRSAEEQPSHLGHGLVPSFRKESMIHHLYPDFMETDESYGLAVAFWEDLVGRIQPPASQHDVWESAIPKAYADGTPFHDGNPICDLRSKEIGRALRIVQSAPNGEDLEIVAYLDRVSLDNVDELVIALALSKESAALAERLITAWMNPATSRAAMQGEIESLLPAVGS